MDQFGDKPQVAGFGGDGILGQPDAVGQQSVTAGVHDAVQCGVKGLGEGVEAVFGCGEQCSLNLDQSIR